MLNVSSNFFTIAALLVCRSIYSLDFTYELAPKTISPGQRATLSVRLLAKDLQEDDLLPEVYDELVMQNEKFIVLQKDVQKDPPYLIWKYSITSHKPGQLSIPPIQIKYRANSYSTESFNLTIGTSRAEGDEELRPGFGKLSSPFHWKRLLMLAFVTFVLSMAAKKLLVYLSSRRRRRARLETLAPKLTQRDHVLWLRAELEKLKRACIENKGELAVFEQFIRVLKEFFARISEKPALGMTTGEFGKAYSAHPHLKWMLAVLSKADIFKFSPQKSLNVYQFTINGIDEAMQTLCGT